ncbi:MAG: hypothetical protein ACRC2S_16610 [Waterburya sp.]
MSKIQINELNSNSELEVLNNQETSEVVGGFSFNIDASKYAKVDQINYNKNTQVAFGGFGDTYNTNKTDQNNEAYIKQ